MSGNLEKLPRTARKNLLLLRFYSILGQSNSIKNSIKSDIVS